MLQLLRVISSDIRLEFGISQCTAVHIKSENGTHLGVSFCQSVKR